MPNSALAAARRPRLQRAPAADSGNKTKDHQPPCSPNIRGLAHSTLDQYPITASIYIYICIYVYTNITSTILTYTHEMCMSTYICMVYIYIHRHTHIHASVYIYMNVCAHV